VANVLVPINPTKKDGKMSGVAQATIRHDIWKTVDPSCQVCTFFGWKAFSQCKVKNPRDFCEGFGWDFVKLNKIVDERLCERLEWLEKE